MEKCYLCDGYVIEPVYVQIIVNQSFSNIIVIRVLCHSCGIRVQRDIEGIKCMSRCGR